MGQMSSQVSQWKNGIFGCSSERVEVQQQKLRVLFVLYSFAKLSLLSSVFIQKICLISPGMYENHIWMKATFDKCENNTQGTRNENQRVILIACRKIPECVLLWHLLCMTCHIVTHFLGRFPQFWALLLTRDVVILFWICFCTKFLMWVLRPKQIIRARITGVWIANALSFAVSDGSFESTKGATNATVFRFLRGRRQPQFRTRYWKPPSLTEKQSLKMTSV